MASYNEIRLYRSMPNKWTSEQIEQWNKYWSLMGAPMLAGKQQYFSFGNGVPVEVRLGSLMWKFLKEGVLVSIDGLNNVTNFVKVTKAYLDSEFEKIEVKDEEGKVIGTETIKVRDKFQVAKENATHGLIKLTEGNWKLLEAKFNYTTVQAHGDTITNYPLSILSEKNYLEAIAKGGEFYKEPVIEV